MLSLVSPRSHRRLARIAAQLATLAPLPPATLAHQQADSGCGSACASASDSSPLAAEVSPLVEQIHAFTKAANTRVAIMATGAGSVRALPSITPSGPD
jgi:hypothetical protein